MIFLNLLITLLQSLLNFILLILDSCYCNVKDPRLSIETADLCFYININILRQAGKTERSRFHEEPAYIAAGIMIFLYIIFFHLTFFSEIKIIHIDPDNLRRMFGLKVISFISVSGYDSPARRGDMSFL